MEDDSLNYARGKVFAPAITLVVMCLISLGLLLLALAFDLWFVLSGTARRMAQAREGAQEIAIVIRVLWSLLMSVSNVVILTGALRMKELRNRGLSQVACILALIPCLGPCFVLGIPFGIWGLVALNDPDVRRSFET